MGWGLFWLILGGLVLGAWMRLRGRLASPGGDGPRVDDDAVRRIVEEGVIRTEEEEPLDLGEIQEEERRFWEEGWEEPEEW